jgi:hypothetical protein
MLTFHRVTRKKLWFQPSATRLNRLAERKANALCTVRIAWVKGKKYPKINELVKVLGDCSLGK